MRIEFNVFLSIGFLAGVCVAADPPPHPGEPADHRQLKPEATGTAARIYAREHPEGPPRVEPVYAKIGKVDHWEILLPKVHPAGKDAILTLGIRDGSVVSGYTLAPAADNFFHYTSTYRLDLAGDKLTGSVRIRFLDKNGLNAAECLQFGREKVVILNVKTAGGKLTGSGNVVGGDSFDIAGVVHTGGCPPRPEDALAGGALWPGHRGPLASGAALDKGYALVEDPNKARPAWKCAEDLPDGRAHHSGGGPLGTIGSGVDWLRHSGSKCGPVVADGCVYLYTMIPSGTIPKNDPTVARFDEAVLSQAAHDWMPNSGGGGSVAVPLPGDEPDDQPAKSVTPPRSSPADDLDEPAVKPTASSKVSVQSKPVKTVNDELDDLVGKPAASAVKPRFYPQRTMFCVGADDVVFCFDASTGATLWKTVYPGASANYGGSKGGPQLCPFVWQGKIYALGSTERIYCLDAKTGKEIWQGHTGWAAACKYKVLQDCLASGEGFPRNRSMEYSLTVADQSATGSSNGVVVCSDGRGKLYQGDGYGYTKGPGLIGLDAMTGKRLWQTEEGVIGSSTPVRWMHKGKMYILTATDAVRCFEPATGKMLWKVPCDQTGMCLVADEDHMLAQVNGTVTCLAVTPEKAEKMWSLPKQYQMPWGGYFYPVIYRGHVYFASGGESSVVCVRLSDGEVIAEAPDLGGGHTGGGAFLIAGEERTFSSGICVTGAEENTKPVKGSPWRVAFGIGYLGPMDAVLADGRLFIRDKTGIVCYDMREPKKR